METRYTEEKEFILLSKLILEDNEKIKKLKTIYQKEERYADFLGPIESFIAYYFYYDAPKLKDVDVIKAVRNIKSKWDKDISFFDKIFEKEMFGVISLTLRKNNRKITKHELFLILGYILWAVDNRKWMGDSRAYLKWLCDFFNLFDKDEKKAHHSEYDSLKDSLNIDEKKIKLMKGEKADFEPLAKDIALDRIDSAKFAEYDELNDSGSDNLDEDYDEEDIEDENDFWESGGFIESISDEDMKKKMSTFNKGHDEDVNYDCDKCGVKISAHNRDWHDGMCDKCFNMEYYGEI